MASSCSNLATKHTPVLVKEALNYLLEGLTVSLDKAVFVDATFGSGGHSKALFEAGARHIYSIDRDPLALRHARELQQDIGPHQNLVTAQGPFSDMSAILKKSGIGPGSVHGILMDLGTSTMQLSNGERGFSFARSGPLDMRMDPTRGATAKELLDSLSEEQLSSCLWKYGEERLHRRISCAIVQARKKGSLETTYHLAEVVAEAVGWKRRAGLRDGLNRGIHPATRTFQALRIMVNNELEELCLGLLATPKILSPQGRLVVISFHSLEDRIVKRFFGGAVSLSCLFQPALRQGGYQQQRRNALKRIDDDDNDVDVAVNESCDRSSDNGPVWRWSPLHSKVIMATTQEVMANPKARSAKLRAATFNVVS